MPISWQLVTDTASAAGCFNTTDSGWLPVAPDAPASTSPGAIGHGWLDRQGNVWAVLSGKITANPTSNSAFGTNDLFRPTGENVRDGRVAIETDNNTDSSRAHLIVLRWQGNNDCYIGDFNAGTLTIFKYVGGGLTQIGGTQTIAGYDGTHKYRYDMGASGSSSVLFDFIVTDMTSATTALSSSITDSSPPAQLQGTGRIGVVINGGNGGSPGPIHGFTRIQTYQNITFGATIAVNDANNYYSPYGWLISGSSFAKTNLLGYQKLTFTGTSAGFLLDTTSLTTGSIPATRCPRIRWSIDNAPWQIYQIQPGDTQVVLATGLAAGNHVLLLELLGIDDYSDKWTNQYSSVKTLGTGVDAGATSVAQTLRTKRAIFYTDSIGAALWVGGTSTDTSKAVLYAQAEQAWTAFVAEALDAEYGLVAYGSTSFDIPSPIGSNVPALQTHYNLLWNGQARTFSPAPDYVFVAHGTNGVNSGVNINTTLAAIRAAVGDSAIIFVLLPFGGQQASTITTQFNSWHSTDTGPSYLLNVGSYAGLAQGGTASANSLDGLHPNSNMHSRFGAKIVSLVRIAVTPATTRTVTKATRRGRS